MSGYRYRAGAWARFLAVLVVSACSRPSAPVPEPVACAPFEPVPAGPLGLEAAREAHRRAELRRHLRFEDALAPGATLRLTARMAASDAVRAGRVCFADLYESGRILFEHEYAFADGLAGGDAASRPGGPFRRVQERESAREGSLSRGPETISCTSCHWRGGPGGGGVVQDDSYLGGDGDRPETADARNPPLLLGAGVVQALAEDMTAELAAIRRDAVARAQQSGKPEEARLETKGVYFGYLRVAPDGRVDTSGVQGVDTDLVIRPFGWKGNFATLREFIIESLDVHHGIESEELTAMHGGPGDRDNDGVAPELTHGQLTALVVYVASLGLPLAGPPEPVPPLPPRAQGLRPLEPRRFDDDWLRGRRLFEDVGCATCHVSMMVLKNPRFVTRGADGSEYVLDLAAQAEHPRLAYDEALGGYPVYLFSDLKRHDMGQENAARYPQRGVAEAMYMTRRLWGLAHSAPYFYDGRASWVDDAILAHGGEAALAREEFAALSREDRAALRLFLMSLRREPRALVP